MVAEGAHTGGGAYSRAGRAAGPSSQRPGSPAAAATQRGGPAMIGLADPNVWQFTSSVLRRQLRQCCRNPCRNSDAAASDGHVAATCSMSQMIDRDIW